MSSSCSPFLPPGAGGRPPERTRGHVVPRSSTPRRAASCSAGPQKPKFTPDGKTVLFLRAEPKSPKLKLFEFDVATGKTRELLSPETLLKGGEENLTPEEKARRERQRVSVGGFTDFHLDDGRQERPAWRSSGKLYVFDRATGKATRTEDRRRRRDRRSRSGRPDGKKVAYVRGHDVYVYDLATRQGVAGHDGRHRDRRRTAWPSSSPRRRWAASAATGGRPTRSSSPTRRPTTPASRRGTSPTRSSRTRSRAEQFYPRPGKKNVAVRLGVVPVDGRRDGVGRVGPRRSTSTWRAVRWDEGRAADAPVQDRDQQELALLAGRPDTGQDDGRSQ